MKWIASHGRGMTLALALLIAAGAVALDKLPSGLYPELSFPRIAVVATLADATSEMVLRNVTRPLDEALMPILGIRRVRSRTIRGAVEISLLFDPASDMVASLQLVQSTLAEVRADLPPQTRVVAERITPTSFPIYTINVEGSVPPTQLRDIALYQVRPELSRVPGVGPITVTAGWEREVEVIVDPTRAQAAGLTPDEIAARLSAENRLATVGRLVRAYRRYAIVVRGDATDAAALGQTIVGGSERAPVRLSDVARVIDGSADPRLLVESPHGPAAVVNVSRRRGGDVIALDAALDDALARLRKQLPPGVTLTPVYQQAPLIVAATGAVRDAIVVGACLSAMVIFFFLRDWRATLLAALTIPASLLAACAVIALGGGSFNLMSLGGMAIAVGLVIDDAVVMVEAIARERAAGRSPFAAAERGISLLGGPVLSSTITTVVVFAPLAFLSGVVGSFFAALAVALAAAVTASLLLALTVVPLIAARLRHSAVSSEVRHSAAPIDRASQRYGEWLARALARPGRTVAIAAGVALVTLGAAHFVESGFLPEIDEGAFVLDYFAPIGTSLDEADRLARGIDAIVAADPDVATFTRRLGAELGPPRATETSRGDIMVRLRERHRPIDEIMETLRRQIAARLPGVRTELIQLLSDMLGDLEGNPEPIELKLFGPDQVELRRQAARVAACIKDVPGLVDLFDGQVACSPERVLRVEPVLAGRLGLSSESIARQLDAALLGAESTPLSDGDRLVPVRVRWPDGARFDPHVLERVRLKSPSGTFIPLGEVAHVDDGCAPSEIDRENLRLMVPVTARLEGIDLGSAVAAVESRLADLHLPPGYTIELGGQRVSQKESFTALGLALGGALALVVVVLVFQLGSFRAAGSIVAALPLALGGGLVALFVTHVPVNVSSLLGAILLIGLAVKNGILLLHAARVEESAGATRELALVSAAKTRLRPILMTTACTLLGLLPLALGIGSGAEMHRPLAVAVLGGLILSTVGTLFVVPSLYALGKRR